MCWWVDGIVPFAFIADAEPPQPFDGRAYPGADCEVLRIAFQCAGVVVEEQSRRIDRVWKLIRGLPVLDDGRDRAAHAGLVGSLIVNADESIPISCRQAGIIGGQDS